MPTEPAPPPPVLLTTPELAPAASARAFALHRAACEWQLDRPILLRGEADLLSRDQIAVAPYAHQVRNLVTFCRRAPVALLADDVGLGKTISAGLILTELVLRGRVDKALVVCPRILVAQWERELTDKFNLPVVTATGKQVREVAAFERGVLVTTYETARDHLEAIGEAGFQMLILDEAHRLRRLHGTDKPPRLAVRIRHGLEQRWFKYVLLLTATPIQNRVWDLYSLVDVLAIAKGHRHPLGTPDEFADRYIAGPRDKALEIHPARLAEFRGHVRGYIARTRRAEAGLLFPRRLVWLRRVEATLAELDLARQLGRHIDRLSALAQISLAQALMSSPHALAAQLENMLPRARFLEPCLSAARQVLEGGQTPAKMADLGALVDEQRKTRPEDYRVVVFTQRRETQTAIGAFLEERGIACAFIRGGSARENQAAIDRFTAEPPEVHVLVSTDAGAEGVNLQAANVLVNYDLPWNPMILEQRIGRVQRLGSTHAKVSVLNLVVRGSVEERVVARLAEKLQVIGEAVGEIDAILESATSGAKDGDVGEAFEEMIRKLVVESLQGKDVDAAVRLEEASLEEAKLLFDENQQVIDAQLGELDAGPAAPDLPAQEPSMALRDFVIGALEEEGAQVTETGAGLVVVREDGMAFRAVVGAEERLPGVHVYAPGEPSFEGLVERWASQHAALVHDHGHAGDEVLRAIAERWCAPIGNAVVLDVARVSSRAAFQGDIDGVVKAVVAHDGYEKVMTLACCPVGHTRIESEEETFAGEPVSVGSLFDGAERAIEDAVRTDPAVSEFCRFYEQRRAEELDRVGSGEERRVEESFTPTLSVSVVGVHGHRYQIERLRITVEVDGTAQYEAEIEVIPPTAQILAEPPMATCALTGRRVPASWVGTCAVSGKRVLRHLLQQAEGGTSRALPEHIGRSVITGKSLLMSELGKSDVSGALAEVELLVVSAISPRRGLPSEIARCDFSGKAVLLDEIVTSQISGRPLRKDEAVASAISGVSGHVSEMVKCAASGAYVLPEETGTSAVSGRRVRRDWLVTSEKSPHRVGAKGELRRCQKTGKWLLDDELMFSAGFKLVDKSLLVQSEVSEVLGLPEEMVTCEQTGKRVAWGEAPACIVTGRRILESLMVKSAASGGYMAPGQEILSELSGKPMAPREAFTCPWSGLRVLPQESAACRRTGLRVAMSALNAQGELAALRQVLDAPAEVGADAPDVVAWFQQIRAYPFRDAATAWSIPSPTGTLRAVAVRCPWLARIMHQMVGLVVRGADETIEMAGTGFTTGYLNPRGFVLSEDRREVPDDAHVWEVLTRRAG